MKHFLLILLFVASPAFTMAQDNGDSESEPKDEQNGVDTFNDPFFTKPLGDFLEDNTLKGQVRRVDSVVTQRRRIDINPADFTGRAGYPGANDLYPGMAYMEYENGIFRYNRVDGLFLGGNIEPLRWHRGNKVGKLYGSLGYGFASKNWQYGLGYERIFGIRESFKIGGGYHSMTFSDDMWRVGKTENTLYGLFAGFDFMDYHHRHGLNIYAVGKTTQFIEHTLRFRSEEYESQELNTRYSFFGKRSTFRENPMINDGYMQSLEWTTGFQTGGLILNNRLIFEGDIRAELGSLDFLDSDFDFNRYEAEIRTIYQIDPANMINWRLRGGTSTGVLPIQREFALGGIGTMRGRDFKSMTGSQMIVSNLELHLSSYRYSGDLSDRVNWSRYLVYIFLDSGWVNENPADPSDPFEGFSQFSVSELKHDVGIGFSISESRASILRFELAWPTEDLRRSPNFIVRFNPTF